MADTMTKRQRSRTMSRIRSRWTSIERTVHEWLAGEGVVHTMHPKIGGNPDIEIPTGGGPLYVFVDGCFWHCCPDHYSRPKSRQEFWIPHVEDSDRRREGMRRSLPYRWIRVWEHDVKNGKFREIIRGALEAVAEGSKRKRT